MEKDIILIELEKLILLIEKKDVYYKGVRDTLLDNINKKNEFYNLYRNLIGYSTHADFTEEEYMRVKKIIKLMEEYLKINFDC